MNPCIALAKRNMLCYFRDWQNVVFSLMAVIIVVLLYLLFLRNMLIDSYPEIPGINHLIDVWVMSGILGIVPVTTCAGSLQKMVEDRVDKRDRDLLVTPAKPSDIVLGYVLSTFLVGVTMSLITLVICLTYLGTTGCPLSATGILETIVLIVPSALSASIIMYTISSFIRSNGAFSGLFTVVSVLIGFLAGIYMPMGTMPSGMQVVGTLVPASQMGALFRDTLANDAFETAFADAPAETVQNFRYDMGFDLSIGGLDLSIGLMLVYVIAIAVVFFTIAALRIRKE